MRDLVDFRFDCSAFARSHSMTDVEGGKLPFAAIHTEDCFAGEHALRSDRPDTRARALS